MQGLSLKSGGGRNLGRIGFKPHFNSWICKIMLCSRVMVDLPSRAISKLIKVLPRAFKRREGMQLGKHQNSNVGGRMCMNASCSRFLLIERRQNVADS